MKSHLFAMTNAMVSPSPPVALAAPALPLRDSAVEGAIPRVGRQRYQGRLTTVMKGWDSTV